MNGNGRRWPLLLIAASAAAAIWSGWVGLGELCGFGVIHPLPGIVPAFQINAAITLPVSVEAYGAYALGAWMRPETPERARKFARRSAIGALAYGAAGQVAYHLLAAAGATAAPWPVVVVVSCMPVAVLGLAAALTHLLRLPPEPERVSAPVSAGPSRGYKPPPQRKIMTSLGVGQGKARQFQRLLVSEVAAHERGRGMGARPVPVAAPAGPAPVPAGALNGQAARG